MFSLNARPTTEIHARGHQRKFTSDILCADNWENGILVGTSTELCYYDKATQKWTSIISNRSFKQVEVLEKQNILVTISGKKQKIRVCYLSWLRGIYLKTESIDKKIGWTNVGHDELMECTEFKIVIYERIKFLVIAMHDSIEIYEWAPKPYHKFMAYKSVTDLRGQPEMINLLISHGRTIILTYGSKEGFLAVDFDTNETYCLISHNQGDVDYKNHAITAVAESDSEIMLHYNNHSMCVDVRSNGSTVKKEIYWVRQPTIVADIGYGLFIGGADGLFEIWDIKNDNTVGNRIHGPDVDTMFLFANYEKTTSQLELWFASRRQLYSVTVPFEDRKADDTVLATEIKKLGLATADDFADMIKKGSYKCYWNRLYFVGPYNVGKTTLAKLLVGDPIPEERKSTDGIWLYLGRAGMDTAERKWVYLPKGTSPNATVISMLMTMQNEDNKSSTATQSHCDFLEKSEEDELSEVGTALGLEQSKQKLKDESNEACAGPDPRIDINMDAYIANALHAATSDTHRKQKPTGIIQDKLEVVTSNADIYDLVIATYQKGQFKMKIVPIDIWDFGGQKDYYMTHQLFISSRGTYAIMFNGSVDLHKAIPGLSNLPGHSGNMTTAVYLVHWVNSILTYCRKNVDGYPKILFVATHKDVIWKSRIEKQRKMLMQDIEDLFSTHAGKEHLQFTPLIFVDARNPFDNEIEALKKSLLDIAFSHPRWGELMPTTWVPLELEIAEQVQKGLNIISREQLESLNTENQASTMNAKQLNTFLRVQHSLGRLLYFDEENLRDFIVINPIYLIQVLRSIVTEKQFWPKELALLKTFRSLQKHGVLRKSDLFKLWYQKEFSHVLPYKDYMVDMLVHLDILVEPRNPFLQTGIPGVEYFFVPCIITERNTTGYLRKFCTQNTSIHMAYTFIDEVIPPALSYRFIGSFVGMWNLKWYKESQMLFTDNAVVTVDHRHDLSVTLDGNRLVVALIHQTNKKNIAPTISSSVQECLTNIIHKISEFYFSACDDGTTPQDSRTNVMNIPFEIEFGVNCKNGICFCDHRLISKGQNSKWTCPKHGKEHNTSYLNLWFAEKVNNVFTS